MTLPSADHLPPGWPAGRTLAVCVNVMLEAWADDAAPGIGPMGNPLKPGTLDLQARSWAAYGVLTGAWRLLDILAAEGVRAVFYTSGIVAERDPALMAAIAAAGHAVAAHGWTQNVVPATQDAAAEAADLARCTAALTAAVGAAPRGWLSPRCTPSARTTSLLAGAGFVWHADHFDRDLPVPVETQAGPIIAMPFTMEVNDLPLSVRYGAEPEAFTRILERLLAGWPRLGGRPGTIDVTVHAHVFGRPAGALAFAAALSAARRHAGHAWLTEHDSLARLWRPGV